MKKCWFCLFYCCWVTNTASAENLDNRDGVRAATIEAAAAIARFASTFCGLSPAKLAAYKSMTRDRSAEVTRFESSWEDGWAREQKTVRGYEIMRIENPALFSKDVNAGCAELRKLRISDEPRASKVF